MNWQIFILLITLNVNAEQPKANSCKYDEAGASEITCKGYIKLTDNSVGTATDAFQVVESRMWKAALKFCENESKTHEIRNFRKEAPLYSKSEVWVLGGFRCASVSGMK